MKHSIPAIIEVDAKTHDDANARAKDFVSDVRTAELGVDVRLLLKPIKAFSYSEPDND